VKVIVDNSALMVRATNELNIDNMGGGELVN